VGQLVKDVSNLCVQSHGASISPRTLLGVHAHLRTTSAANREFLDETECM
jgi:hypothetical protein